MNYIELINHFWQCDEVHSFTPTETRLYFYLVKVANASGWNESFWHSDTKLSGNVGVSLNPLKTARNRLKQTGLIDFQPGGNGHAAKTRYQLSSQVRCQEMIPKQVPKPVPKPYPNHEPLLDKQNKTKLNQRVSLPTVGIPGGDVGSKPPDSSSKQKSKKSPPLPPTPPPNQQDGFESEPEIETYDAVEVLPDWLTPDLIAEFGRAGTEPFGDGELAGLVAAWRERNPHKYPDSFYADFLSFWTANPLNGSKTREVWKAEKSFNLGGRLATSAKFHLDKHTPHENNARPNPAQTGRNGSSYQTRNGASNRHQQSGDFSSAELDLLLATC